jgi:acetyltransferase-like isoleucine patch superfamily enzyme
MTLPSLAESGSLLLQRRTAAEQARLQLGRIPRRVLQFWDRQPPQQIHKLLEHNRRLVQSAGAEYVFFDADAARAFIAAHATQEVLDAYDIAPHPAMKCDVFRLCHVWKEGGYYVDADLALRNRVEDMFDLRGDCVVFQWDSRDLTNCCNWLFGARAGDPLLESALRETAASILNACRINPDAALKNILSVSGPGIFTRSIAKGMRTLVENACSHQIRLNVQTVSFAHKLIQLGPAFLGEPLDYKLDGDTRHWSTAGEGTADDGPAAAPLPAAPHLLSAADPRPAALAMNPQLKIQDNGQHNLLSVPQDQEGQLSIVVNGSHNRVTIGAGCRISNLRINIRGDHCRIEIGPGCVLAGEFICRDHHTSLIVGEKTTMMGSKITMHEPGTIRIGMDCMFAGEIRMDTSDMHSIVDVASGERLNPPGDIEIGDHVWLAFGVYVLKGVSIGRDCVIGTRAVVADDIPAQSLAVGVPARVVRSGVSWDRRRLPWKGMDEAQALRGEAPSAPVPDTAAKKPAMAQAFSWLRGRKPGG